MSKNIVICSDGTGNTAIKGRGTNVFKLFEAVDLNGHRWDPRLQPQVAFYDDGVGTEDFKPLRVLGGAAGWGLSKNVRQLYRELARIYDRGDRIWMFGFSRGAFTVRTLAGMIGSCGVVDRQHAATDADLDRLVHRAYSAYRACYQTTLGKAVRRVFGGVSRESRQAGIDFARQFGVRPDPRIHFIGVWDTVDAVGLPFHLSDIINATVYRYKFPDRLLSDYVDHAYHALSIDDDRQSFHPLLWDEKRPDGSRDSRIEQVWFAGVHSNVGGGYPKQGMSLLTLDWMMAKAELHGLRFNCRDRDTYRDHSSVDDKLYNPRAGLGTFYRWAPRDIAEMCRIRHVDPIRVHVSAIERIAHGIDDYAPENMPAALTVVVTPAHDARDAALMNRRAENVQRIWDGLFPNGPLLDRLRSTVAAGWLSYYVFLVACTIAAIVIAVVHPNAARARDAVEQSLAGAAFVPAAVVMIARVVAGLIVGLGSVAGAAVGSPIDTSWAAVRALWAHPLWFWIVVIGLIASSVMSRQADARISRVSSAFWHAHQQQLRTALKTAREDVGGGLETAPLCWGSEMRAAVGDRQRLV
jgi:uncharacterized protein (DUF2235 family)